MNILRPPVQNSKIGTCPHGLPPGACPICSGAGGGGAAPKKADLKSNTPELSWSECVAMGQLLKNQRMANHPLEQPIQPQMLAMNFQNNIANFALSISKFIQNSQSAMPSIISKPLAFIANKILIPLLNVLKDIPLNIQKAITQVFEKLADISDKLAAMFGELKNSIEKKISDNIKDFKKKIKSFFGLFEAQGDEDEDRRAEEAKKAFELKTVLETIKEKFTQKKEKLND